jgi:hypothetical protein
MDKIKKKKVAVKLHKKSLCFSRVGNYTRLGRVIQETHYPKLITLNMTQSGF